MRKIRATLMIACLIAGCTPSVDSGPGEKVANESAEANDPVWSLEKTSSLAALVVSRRAAQPLIRLSCERQGARFIVNVPQFKPVGSEERLSFGAGGKVVALVADAGGDQGQGGVTGEGPIPDELKQLIIEPMSATYGAQTSGPHPPPADSIAGPFLSACADFQTAARIAETKPKSGTSPCLVQDGVLLRMGDMRAIGTEPFWNARTEGRCVTYSTPEDQAGTRIWTRVESGPMGPIWVGSFQGKPFALRVQPATGCSDGMSDRRYDYAADLTVGGENRKGCADRR